MLFGKLFFVFKLQSDHRVGFHYEITYQNLITAFSGKREIKLVRNGALKAQQALSHQAALVY